MMRRGIATSLKFRRLIVALAAGVLVAGIVQLRHVPVDQLPEFGPTMVEVRTEALGLSAVEVEQLITTPLEQDLLNGLPFLDEIHSESIPGLSSVLLLFEPGTSMLDARQVVAEKVAEAAVALPGVSELPRMLQPLSSTSRVLTARLSSDKLSAIDMSVLARWVIGPRLLGVDGVANVSIWGQRDRQLQVLVDPQQLQEADVSLQQIVSTAGNGLWYSPLTFLEASTPGTAGFIDTPTQRIGIRHVLPIRTAADLAEVPIEDAEGEAVIVDGKPLQLGDVTQVVEDHQPLIGDALFQEGDGLLVVVEKFPGANTLEVTHGVEEALDAMQPGLGGIQIDTSLFRPADYIEASRDNLVRNLAIGALLLLLVLGLLFFEWRAIVTSSAAIVLSLVAAGFVLYVREAPANAMVLAGLVMALGIVIDDAVADVRNMLERFRRRREEESGAPAWRVILDGSLEMRSSLLFATLIVIAAVVPAFFLEGQPGAFLPPIVLTYLLGVAASMVVAITVTPALGMMLLSGEAATRRESPVIRWLHARFDGSIAPSIRNSRVVYGAFGVVLIAGIVTLPFLQGKSSVGLKETDVLVRWEAAPGTSLPAMREVTSAAVEELGTLPGVDSVSAHVGRAVHSDQIVNVNSGEIWVGLDGSADLDETVESIDTALANYPQMSADVSTYTQDRIGDVLRGTDEDVVVRVYGTDHEVLADKSREIQTLLGGIEGIQRPTIEAPPTEPTVEIEVDLGKAHEFAVSPGDVRRSAAILFSGLAVGNLFEEQKVFDVVVWGTPEIRQSVEDVKDLLIETPEGGHIRLEQVADVRVEENPAVLRHDAVSPYVDVSASIAGRDAGDVVADVERALDTVTFPLEHHSELRGAFQTEGASRTRILAVAIAAAVGAFLLLQAAFTSWRLATLAFVTLPVALAGGAIAALFTGGSLTLGSTVGFVAVLGIAARNSILVIRNFQRLEREGMAFGDELVLRGTRERVAPVLTSALATIAAVLPIVIAGDIAGLEVARPMAVVMLGGAVTSALLAVLVVPGLYLRHGFVSRRDTVADDLTIVLHEAEPETVTIAN